MITTALAPAGVVIRIAGRLEAADVPVLRGALDREPAARGIELSQLPTADEDGIAFLRRCREEGMTLSGASPYVRLLLDADDETVGLPVRSEAMDGPPSVAPPEPGRDLMLASEGRNTEAWQKNRTS